MLQEGKLKRRVAPVSNHTEGAPGPSLLGTGDIDTMREQTSIRVPDASMTLPIACLLSAASAHPSISTGKERDTESGNDYFEARYYSSAMGRFMSPDWSARIEPVPYMVLNEPQSLNLYSYVGNNPLTHIDPDGHQDCTKTTLSFFINGQSAGSISSTVCTQGLDHLEENAYRAASKAARRGAQGLDMFNKWLGFGATNCAGGGDCGDAFGEALGAVAVGIESDGLSEEANAARIEEEIATLSKKWSKGSFDTLEDSFAKHFDKHGAEVGARDLLQYLRKADAFASDLARGSGPKRVPLPEGATRFIKSGKFIIKDAEGLIRTFGKVSD